MLKETSNIVLHTYWTSLKRDRVAPCRHEIEPSSISRILPDVFILEHIRETDEFRFRLAGSSICEIYRKELAFTDIIHLFQSAKDKQVMYQFLNQIKTQVQPGMLKIDSFSMQDLKAEFEMIILPLEHDNQGITRFIGALCVSTPAIWIKRLAVKTSNIQDTQIISHEMPETTVFRLPPSVTHQTQKVVHVKDRVFRVIDGGKV